MRIPKPKHLGPEYASQFADPAVVAAYQYRPAYPSGLFSVLRDLVADEPRTVLDIGCGTGDIARPLAGMVDAVDAVDRSAGMIARGRSLRGGDRPGLSWILGEAEDVALPHARYGLVTAGESLHWMDWDRLLPRLSNLLVPGGYLAMIGRGELPSAWSDALLTLIQQYTTNLDFQPYNVVTELRRRELFAECGTHRTDPVLVRQSVGRYIESIHSRNGFSRDRMTIDAAAAFDREVARLLAAHTTDGALHFEVRGSITWGRPRSPSAAEPA